MWKHRPLQLPGDLSRVHLCFESPSLALLPLPLALAVPFTSLMPPDESASLPRPQFSHL
jgi:hypothetical protein